MDFDDSGIESDRVDQTHGHHLKNGKIGQQHNELDSQKEEIEPTISFVSNRCHFSSVGQIGQKFEQNFIVENKLCAEKNLIENRIRSKIVGDKHFKTELQKRLEKRINQANDINSSKSGNNHFYKGKNSNKNTSNKSSMPSVPHGGGSHQKHDSKKTGLLPPQKMQIPKSQSSSGKSKSENKPLVEWDSDESEEELGFFPPSKNRMKLTDNMSIDNMSLSGEDEDLHLSPPHPVMSQKCPCDPRFYFERWTSNKSSNSSHNNRKCSIV